MRLSLLVAALGAVCVERVLGSCVGSKLKKVLTPCILVHVFLLILDGGCVFLAVGFFYFHLSCLV